MLERAENQALSMADSFYAEDTLGKVNRNAKIDSDLANISKINNKARSASRGNSVGSNKVGNT